MKAKINRKISALFLALFMLFGIMIPAFAAEAVEGSATDGGAENTAAAEDAQSEEAFEIISIRSAEDLLELADLCRLDSWSLGKLVILETDISLSSASFLPIPSFGGVFDGNGHTISGLQIDESINPAGLIGQLQASGIIRNLNVSGSVAPSGDAQFVGGIVGENYGTIIDSTFTGCVIGSDNVGGIAGANTITGRIIGCETRGSVIGKNMTGGIVGCNLGFIGNSNNKAYVNTVSTDPTIHLEDISFDFLTDVSKLSSLDTSTAAMDTGGIAGYSSGILEYCTNRAFVGYPHIGYNVGGIAGRSCGYIHNCENVADIYGRKDVGGIVGQMEPYIAKNLSESSLAKLERQLDELDVLLDQAIEHADGAADSVARRLNGIAGSMNAAGAAAKDIRTSGTITGSVTGSGTSDGSGGITVSPPPEGGISGSGQISGIGGMDAQTQIDISTNLAGLSSAIYGMAGQVSMLSGELSGASEQLYADVQLIREKISEITDTAFEMMLGDGEDDVIIDSSEIDIDLVTMGKVSECVNRCGVNGDINVGGIAGVMAMEYELDPEDDVTIRVTGSERRKYEVKAIIQKCENVGTVISKRNYAGGISGKMDLGLITQCESYGNVSSESGSFVGGIAGIGGSTIRHCFIKCSLSGKKYIGGVVGSGVEEDRKGESSTVAACYAIVTVTDYKQYAGAISGYYAGAFLENYFVSEELAGINRMSYSGKAEPITYDELLRIFASAEEAPADDAVLEETEPAGEANTGGENEAGEPAETEPAVVVPPMELPNEFKIFTLKFVVDGEVIRSEIFDYGASFDQDVFPEIPAKDGCYGYWDRTNLEHLKFDTTVTAIYEPYITALQSSVTRNGDRSIFFVEGLFDGEDCLSAESLALTSGEFDLPDGIWDAFCKSFSNSRLNTEVVEQWKLQIPADGLKTHTIRYLPPDGNTDRINVYIQQDGKWVKIETEVVGSYVTFPASGEKVMIAVVSDMQVWWVWLIVAVPALILGLLMIRLIRKLRKRKAKAAPATERNASKEGGSVEHMPDPVPAPAVPKKEKRWLTPLLVVLALLLGIGGTAAFFLLPELLAGAEAYDLLKDYTEKEEVSMSLQAEAVVGQQSIQVDALLDRITLEGQAVTVVSENGRTLYYSDGAVFLENGDAYQISDAFPDYSGLLEQTMALYKHVDIEAVNNTYSITAEKEHAEAILKLLIPSAAPFLSETNCLNIDLIAKAGELEQIRFYGSGKLNDKNETAISVSAVLKCNDTPRDIKIPQAVAESIQSGAYKTMGTLSDDFLRLVNGWQDLNDRNPLYARLTLNADCGPLAINDYLDFYRWLTEDGEIFSIQENGYALYFTQDSLCDVNGNRIPIGNASNMDAAQLLDIAYTFCMNASADCESNGSRYIYTVSLDEEGMEQVAYAIAPEAKKLDITFTSGDLVIVISNEKIESMGVTVRGSLHVVLTSTDVTMGAKLEFAERNSEAKVPEAVMEALQK
ncbi:MAG: hypothetical protein ACI3W5_06970 [Faecousia sp.]